MIRAALLAVLVLCGACSKSTSTGESAGSGSATKLVNTPAIDDFRATERTVLATFNDALHRQKANQIDELALADAIDHDVLPPWRELRARIAKAEIPPADADLFATLTHYLAARETAFAAYAAALRAPSDAAAQPHYATYHAQADAATDDARHLGTLFRSL